MELREDRVNQLLAGTAVLIQAIGISLLHYFGLINLQGLWHCWLLFF